MVAEGHNRRHLPWPLLEGTQFTQSNPDTELRDEQPTSVFLRHSKSVIQKPPGACLYIALDSVSSIL
jgi:hypothetical protein